MDLSPCTHLNRKYITDKNDLKQSGCLTKHNLNERARLARLAPLNRLSPPVKYFTDRSSAVLLLWIFYVFFSVLCLLCLCARLGSVYMCFVVTCWERAEFVVYNCEFASFPLVSWVRYGT